MLSKPEQAAENHPVVENPRKEVKAAENRNPVNQARKNRRKAVNNLFVRLKDADFHKLKNSRFKIQDYSQGILNFESRILIRDNENPRLLDKIL